MFNNRFFFIIGRLLQKSDPVTSSTVAFFAQMSSKIPASEATGNHVMVFDVVKTNAGNGYHPSTGVFFLLYPNLVSTCSRGVSGIAIDTTIPQN